VVFLPELRQTTELERFAVYGEPLWRSSRKCERLLSGIMLYVLMESSQQKAAAGATMPARLKQRATKGNATSAC
jgi:hypothetical protein